MAQQPQQLRDEVTRRVGFMRKYTPLVLSSLITANRSATGSHLVHEAVRTTEELCRQLEAWEARKLKEREG